MSWVARNSNGDSWTNVREGGGPIEFRFRTDHTLVGSYTYTSTANGIEEPTTNGRWVGKWSMGGEVDRHPFATTVIKTNSFCSFSAI